MKIPVDQTGHLDWDVLKMPSLEDTSLVTTFPLLT